MYFKKGKRCLSFDLKRAVHEEKVEREMYALVTGRD